MTLNLTPDQQAIVDAATPGLLQNAAQAAFWAAFTTSNQANLQTLVQNTVTAYLAQFPDSAANAKSLALQSVRQNINKILNGVKLS